MRLTQKIKRPTSMLMGGPAKDGKLIFGEDWVSNGIWGVRCDRLKRPAVVTTGIRLEKGNMVMVLKMVERSREECSPTNEREIAHIRRSYKGKSDKTDPIEYLKLTRHEGGEDVWVNALVFDWLQGLGAGRWYTGHNFGDPLRFTQDGFTVACLSPVRR